MSEAALAIENIEVVYNHSVQALRGLSIEVPSGQIVALLGSNGAGKSTTLKAASGILPYEKGALAEGQIRFYGQDIRGHAAHTLARMGMAHVREGRHIFADLTVEENLIAAGNALKGRTGEVLDIELVFKYFPGFWNAGNKWQVTCLVASNKCSPLAEPSSVNPD